MDSLIPATDNSSPLLSPSADNSQRSRRSGQRSQQTLRGAARFLRRASGRRMLLREPSVRVRETAAEQLEERQSDWAYSKPVIVLDMLWNAAFVSIALVVLFLSIDENPSVPLRLWISAYALQCAFHMLCVAVEYRRRRRETRLAELEAGRGWQSGGDFNSGSGNDGEDYAVEQNRGDSGTRSVLILSKSVFG